MAGIFQRGQLDLSQLIGYFLVGKSGSGTYYIYQDPPSTADAQTHGVFGSTKYTFESTWSPKIMFVQPNGDGTYQFSSSALPGGTSTPFYSGSYSTSSNVMEISDAGQTPAKIKLLPTTNVGTQALWAGTWYQTLDTNNNPLNWKALAPLNSTGNFKGVTGTADPAVVTDPTFRIMLIPRDAGTNGSIAVWNGSAGCQLPQGNGASLVLWGNWVDGDSNAPSGCDGPGWLIGGSATAAGAAGCVFTSTQTCTQGYLYTVCGQGQTCGTCLGPCPAASDGTVGVCMHDYNPSLESAGTSPLSCNPRNPTPLTFWEQYKWALIILIIVGFLIVVFLVWLFWFLFHRRGPRAG